jgi:hypothetical protein
VTLFDELFGIPPELVWECAAERIGHPPPPSFDSLIISDFPELFASVAGAVAMVLVFLNFMTDVTVGQIL